MASKQWLSGAAAALALAAMTGAAQSASLGSVATDFKPDTTSNFERAQYQLCSMERGVRRCRNVQLYGPSKRVAPVRRAARVAPRVYGYQPPVAGVYGAGVYGYAPAAPLVAGPVYGYQPLAPVLEGYAAPVYRQYGYEYPDQYPVGSGAWWKSMHQTDRDGSNSSR